MAPTSQSQAATTEKPSKHLASNASYMHACDGIVNDLELDIINKNYGNSSHNKLGTKLP